MAEPCRTYEDAPRLDARDVETVGRRPWIIGEGAPDFLGVGSLDDQQRAQASLLASRKGAGKVDEAFVSEGVREPGVVVDGWLGSGFLRQTKRVRPPV